MKVNRAISVISLLCDRDDSTLDYVICSDLALVADATAAFPLCLGGS